MRSPYKINGCRNLKKIKVSPDFWICDRYENYIHENFLAFFHVVNILVLGVRRFLILGSGVTEFQILEIFSS